MARYGNELMQPNRRRGIEVRFWANAREVRRLKALCAHHETTPSELLRRLIFDAFKVYEAKHPSVRL